MARAPKPPYSGRRRDETGKLVPAIAKPADAALLRVLADADAALKAGRRWSVCGLESEAWNVLLRALPICECGVPVAPRRARSGGRYCSDECRKRRDGRCTAKRKRDRAAEARAIAEALFQM